MKKLFLLLTLSIVSLSCEIVDEKLDELLGGNKVNNGVVTDIPNNQIWYTSTDGEIVEPYDPAAFNVSIISNTYEKGQGIITFAGEVTTIGDSAFKYQNLTSINIPDSVTSIGIKAFRWCDSLKSIAIPDSVTSIGKRAFEMCGIKSVYINNLTAWCNISFENYDSNPLYDANELYLNNELVTDLTIPESVTTIGDYAFYSCDNITSVTIPDSVTTIGEGAFAICGSLTSVIIPDSVTTIGESAFDGCSSLTSVTIPDSVTTIGDGAFNYCSSLKEFNGKFASGNGRCLIVNGELNAFARADITEYTIPDNVTSIGVSVFGGCGNLTSITIPNSVTTIGSYAFSFCKSLTSVTIPDSVIEIGVEAFAGCEYLTYVTIGNGVTTIGAGAFNACKSLQEFKGKIASEDGRCLIIDGVLKAYAPAGSTEYTIPDNVIAIGEWAFPNCSFRNITLPEGLTTIEECAFINCYLPEITIPDSVTMIGERVFDDCESLTSVYCKAITPPGLGDNAFKSKTYASIDDWDDNDDDSYIKIGCDIYVPTESVDAYKSAEGWSEYAEDIVGYNFEE